MGLKDPTLDSDRGTAGHLPQGILSQAGVGATILWQGILDVKLGHACLTDGVSKLDGLSCRGKHRRAQARSTWWWGTSSDPSWATVMTLGLAQIHGGQEWAWKDRAESLWKNLACRMAKTDSWHFGIISIPHTWEESCRVAHSPVADRVDLTRTEHVALSSFEMSPK